MVTGCFGRAVSVAAVGIGAVLSIARVNPIPIDPLPSLARDPDGAVVLAQVFVMARLIVSEKTLLVPPAIKQSF